MTSNTEPSQRPIKLKAWDSELGAFVPLLSLSQLYNPRPALTTIQFTGVYDANGREIWEGDILYYCCACDDEDNELFEVWYEVIYIRGDFGAGLDEEFWAFANYEEIPYMVIGNVFENLQMLTKEAK